jgi:DNA topoisomerase-1
LTFAFFPIKLEEALELFNMPRTIGETDDFGVIKANYGRFGPYIQYGKKYVSLKEITPEEVTLNEALTLIKAKEKFDAERIIKTFDDSEIQVLNGRFGPYIWNGKKKGKGQKNITIKKVLGDKEPKDLSVEECKKAVAGKPKRTLTGLPLLGSVPSSRMPWVSSREISAASSTFWWKGL